MNTRKKPSLVFDARMFNVSGIGTVCQNTLPYLIDDFSVTLMGDPDELNKIAWAANVKIISLKSKIYSLQEQLELFLNIPSCDYFLSPHYNIPLLPIKANQRLVLIHDVNHIALAKNISFLKKIYSKAVINFALKLSNKIVTVSEFSKSEIVKYFKTNLAIYPIVLGVNKEVFKIYNDSEKEQVRIRYKLPEQFLLYVGNVKPHKNISVLIKSLAIIKAKKPAYNHKLVIVGKKEGFITDDKSLFDEILNLNLYNDIVFTGFVNNEDLPIIYNLASLFVFPSLYEGFGLPPIEAMACGCPTIVSNTSSLPEVCKDAALYFNPLNASELAETIMKVLDDKVLQNQLISSGFSLVKQYNWENTAQQLKEIIQSN